jgi:hypothetical protein
MDDIVLRTIVHRFSDPESPDGYSVGFEAIWYARHLTEDLAMLASNLREGGLEATVEEPMPYDNLLRHGWSIPVEDVLIFIGSGVGGALINATITDIYNSAKDWARVRFKKKRKEDPAWQVKNRFTIYGPDGKQLLRWELDSHVEGWQLPSSDESESPHESSNSPES